MRPKGKAETLEVRRRIAGKLLQEGMGLRKVARLVDAAPSSVGRWKAMLEKDGEAGLNARPHPPHPARLSEAQKQELAQALLKGPQAWGFPTDLWTLPRVAAVIERQFEVKYHPGHVWHILHGMGWSAQKPEKRARERDEATIQRWREEDWTRIKKSRPTGIDHRVDRREWFHAATGGASHLGSAGADPDRIQLGPP